MKWARCIPVFVLMLTLWACQSDNRSKITVAQDPAVNPWTKLTLNNNPEDFHFAIVSDRNGRNRPGVFESAIDKLNLLQPEFVLSVGDFIKGYSQKDAELELWWNEFQASIALLEMPFFYVPGNHDLTNPLQEKHWKARFGRTYYHFLYRDVLFLCINTEDPYTSDMANISPAQVAYMVKTLQAHKNPRWTFVFMHEPMWTYDKKTGWPEIENELQGRPHTVFAGHLHTYTKYVNKGNNYIVLAATGGGLKEHLQKPELGSFDHITWVTMKKDGPRIANLVLGGILDENVRTPQTAKLLKDALKVNMLQIDPLYTQSPEFTHASTKLRVTNNASEPMKFTGQFLANSQLLITPTTCDFTVAPHSTQTLDLNIQAAKPTPAFTLLPLTLNGACTFQFPGQVPLEIKQTATIGVEQLQICSPRKAPPAVIDGKLDEWTELPLVCEKPAETAQAATWKSPADSSYRFAVQHDDRFLYIAVRVTDDKPIFNPQLYPWQQDGIEIRLDARSDPQRSQNRDLKDTKDILLLSLSSDPQSNQLVVHKRENIPPGVQFASVRTAEGHTTEVAIPIEYLNTQQGQAWEAFRLNIVVNDFDTPEGPGKHLWWRPDWRRNANIIGSGTFLRR